MLDDPGAESNNELAINTPQGYYLLQFDYSGSKFDTTDKIILSVTQSL